MLNEPQDAVSTLFFKQGNLRKNMSSNLQNPLEYLEISALRGVDSLLNKVPQFYKQQVIGQSHRNTQQSENSQSKDKAALLNVGSLLTGQAQTKEQTQTEVVAFVEDTPATLQTSPPNTATTESCLCACTQCLNLQASPADTKTDRAEFKTSTSFGGGFNGSPLKWSQPNGKGSNIDITYSFTKNIKIPGLNTNQVKSLFTEALSTWSEYAPLNFKEIADPGNGRDVDIRVGSEFIDGRSNTLAFAYFPGGGDITFDSGDSWNNSLFLETAVHEIGHSLGLAHEEGVSAIMNPTIANRYAGQTDAFLLQDDINGIVSLYGRGKGSVQTLGQPTPPTPDPDPTPAPNPDPTPKPKPNGRNFVRNGSFEKSDVPKNEFGVFQQVKGWTTISGSGIQIDKRRNVFGEAAKGRSWAELDSNSNSTISQQLRTKEGKSYKLTFQYSPRQG